MAKKNVFELRALVTFVAAVYNVINDAVSKPPVMIIDSLRFQHYDSKETIVEQINAWVPLIFEKVFNTDLHKIGRVAVCSVHIDVDGISSTRDIVIKPGYIGKYELEKDLKEGELHAYLAETLAAAIVEAYNESAKQAKFKEYVRYTN